jgi:UDP-N-acetylglucosamine--N-acetylmuramyl-(pentapeptide) pyrophosphoryl-undecaprenol N-acetylglucosamine transferase
MHVVLAAGGTAGHIYPAIYTAMAIRELDPAIRITILGTSRGLDRQLVPPSGFDLKLIDSAPFPRRINGQTFIFPIKLGRAFRESRDFMKKEKVTCVVGFGGYASAPAYLAARSLGICTIVHEANSTAGLANRLGAKLTRHVAVNYPNAIAHARQIGMPIAPQMTHVNRQKLHNESRDFFDLPATGPVLLVFGGSQGAVSLNQAVHDSIPLLLSHGISVLHAVGPGNISDQNRMAHDLSPTGGAVYRQVPFIDRMDLAYAAADLSVSRAGAMTVAEIASVGIPSIFVPLPIGNGEQERNARPLVNAGASLICPQDQFTVEWITGNIPPLIRDSDALARMTERTQLGNASDAARDLAQWVLACDRE